METIHNKEKKRGILYIAFGESYRQECSQSIQSLKAFHPELPICVVTDAPWQYDPEPEVIQIRKAILNLGAKPAYIGDTPFEETLYLDTDTRIVRPIIAIFDLLRNYDIGIKFRSQFLRGDPYFLPWCNSGVILFRKNESVSHTFKQWLQMYNQAEMEQPGIKILDDRCLSVAIAQGNARVIHLASALNFFLGEPQTTSSPLRIIHSRNGIEIKAAQEINHEWNAQLDWNHRIWIPQLKGYFPQGGLRPPGMWVHDPLIALSVLLRRMIHAIRSRLIAR